ncbi:hypothetical protein Tco_0935521 [Tanacetum coccineum]
MSQPANDEFSQHLSDDEASNHEDASDTGAAPKQQQQAIPQTTAISNIKLPILKKEEYDIWAMEMEHYLKYIDNDVWKVIQNGNSKKRISTGKDGVVRILPPVSPAEIHAVEKERKARTILLMAIPKEHLRRFHGMDDAKEIWEAIRTRFGGNANSKKMQKAVLKQQFKRDSFYQDQGAGKKEQKQNCLLTMGDGVVNWGEHTVEEEESNHALMAISSSNEDLLHEDLEQIDDLDIEEMDINWQIAMIQSNEEVIYKKKKESSSGLELTYAPSTITTQKPTEGELDLLFEAMYDDYIGGQPSSAPRTAPAAQAPQSSSDSNGNYNNSRHNTDTNQFSTSQLQIVQLLHRMMTRSKHNHT